MQKFFIYIILAFMVILVGCTEDESKSVLEDTVTSLQGGYAKVSGTLRDSEGKIIPGVMVRIDQLPGLYATTSSIGEFTIPSVPSGAYSMSIVHDNTTVFTMNNIDISTDTTVDLGIEQFSVPSGIMLTGKLIDEGDKPIAGAKVFIVQHSQILYTTTSADGSYVIANVPPGNITQNILKEEYINSYKSIEVTPGQNISSTTVLIPDADSSIPRYGVINGTVTATDEITPITGAMIAIAGPKGMQQIAHSAFSATDGTFSTKIYEGEYDITVTKSGYQPFFQTITITKGTPLDLKVILKP